MYTFHDNQNQTDTNPASIKSRQSITLWDHFKSYMKHVSNMGQLCETSDVTHELCWFVETCVGQVFSTLQALGGYGVWIGYYITV